MTYDHRASTKRAWDASVLGITQATWAAMDVDERKEYLEESLHRAGDLLHVIVQAFGADMDNGDRQTVERSSKAVITIARKVNK